MKITTLEDNPLHLYKVPQDGMAHPLELSISWDGETSEVTTFFSIGWEKSPSSSQLTVQALPLTRREHLKNSSCLQMQKLSPFFFFLFLIFSHQKLRHIVETCHLISWELMEESQALWRAIQPTNSRPIFFSWKASPS